MPGFEAIYKQTITLFNRKDVEGVTYWYPTVIRNVHLKIDRSIIISTYGEEAKDNAMLHIRYTPSGGNALIYTDGYGSKVYMTPKEFKNYGSVDENITFSFGDEFDFIIEGEHGDIGVVNDEDYSNGFFNYMNKTYDHVFAITQVARFNLIPHFEITAR